LNPSPLERNGRSEGRGARQEFWFMKFEFSRTWKTSAENPANTWLIDLQFDMNSSGVPREIEAIKLKAHLTTKRRKN
jgi:hypothetical protein